MTMVVRLLEIVLSWPVVTFGLALLFRRDISRLHGRLRSLNLPHIEGTFRTSRQNEGS